jgi:uncharacterized membrane protein YfcA
MRRARIIGAIAVVGTGGALAAIDAHDFAQEPPTDTADVVATLAVIVGAAVLFALRWAGGGRPRMRLVRAVAAGVLVGALVTGLVSVIYDPFAP